MKSSSSNNNWLMPMALFILCISLYCMLNFYSLKGLCRRTNDTKNTIPFNGLYLCNLFFGGIPGLYWYRSIGNS